MRSKARGSRGHGGSRARRRSWRAAVVVGMAVSGSPQAAHAVDSWAISIGVRETGVNGAIGSNGGTTGGIEWINLDGQSISADNTWHQYTWNFGTDPVTAFTGGNGTLSAANSKGVLESIRIRNTGGNIGGNISLRIDDIVNTTTAGPTTITGFEEFTTAAASGSMMFRDPVQSTETRAFNSAGVNAALLSTVSGGGSAHTGNNSLAARWTFVPDGSTSQFLHLYTNNTTSLPNPVIDISSTSSVSIWLRASVYNPTGTRAVGIDVSSNQGSGLDWAKIAQPANLGGGGRQFAFIRATRGGTSGTSSTGANRVDDSTFAANIVGAKANGVLTGPYHFARPDLWLQASAGSLLDSPSTPITPEDEARHYTEIAGVYMKPGYMRPVYDLEANVPSGDNAQLTNYVQRFITNLVKYKGPAAAPIIYAGGNFTSQVNSELNTYPLWYPNYNIEGDWSAGNPGTGNYGIWAALGAQPWSFWQNYSPDAYVPGVPGASASNLTHNDLDVAHGDINYVKQYMVPGSIWDGSSSAVWTTAANWDSNAEPISTTEILFDLGIPASGATITLSAGRAASGVYFADNYTLSGGSLSLNDGRIDVDAGKTGTISTSLSTPNGFRKVGLGTMNHATGTSTVTGIAQVLQGTMSVSGGSIAVSGNLMVNPELTQKDKSLVAPFPASASDITSSVMTINGGTVTAAAAYVGGSDTASGAIGTLNVSSGSLAVTGLLKIWDSGLPFIDSKVNFSGGTMSIGSLDTNGDPASFNWTGGTLTVGGDNSSSAFNASGSGAAAMIKTGTGALTLDVANTYSGTTSLNAGTLRLGVNNGVPSTSALTVASGATFDLNGFSDAVGSLAGAGSVLLGSGTLTAGGNNSSTSYSGVISGSGGFVKSGTGAMTLSGASAYSGPTNINGGTLRLAASNSVPSLSALTVASGATFDMNGFSDTVGSLAGAGSVILGSGTLTAGGNNTSTSHSGVISGSGALVKNGSGAMTLSGANTYSGGTTLNLGQLSVSSNGNLGNISGGLTFTNTLAELVTTGSFTTARAVALNASGGTFNTAAGSTLTASGVISGTGSLTKSGSGALVLSGVNTYSGGTTLSNGTLTVSANNNLGNVASGVALNGGTFASTGSFSSTRNWTLGGGATIDVAASQVLTLSGVISGGGAFTHRKQGSGTLLLTSNNTYAGLLRIISGTVKLGASNALPPGSTLDNFSGSGVLDLAGFNQTIVQANSTITNSSASLSTLTITGPVFTPHDDVISGNVAMVYGSGANVTVTGANTYTGGTTLNGGLSISADNNLGNSAGSLTAGTASLNTTASFAMSRPITLNGELTINPNGGTTLTASSVISGTGSVRINGGGRLKLSGVNTYSGGTVLNGGEIEVTSDANLGNISGGITFQNIFGVILASGSFSTPRAVSLTGPGGTFDIVSGNQLTASGVVSGSGQLIKSGAGTLVLSGNNTYTGATTVNAGTLRLGQSSRTSSALVVANGATAALASRTSGVKTLQVGTLNLNATGTLDLNDNDLVVNGASFTAIRDLLLSGFGTSGPGIISTTSNGTQILALFDNALAGSSDWNGAAIGANAIVGKYTYFGDVNFDGQVTGDDYTIVDSNLNSTPPVGLEWLSGDANLDGIVTGDDYTTIDSNLGLGAGNPLTPNALLVVPEPGGIALAGAALLIRRQRRRHDRAG